MRGLIGWDGDTTRWSTPWSGAGAAPRLCAGFSARGGLGVVPGRPLRVLAERIPEPGSPPRSTLWRRRALPDALLDRADGGGADAGHRRPARHRRRLGGVPALVHKALHGTPIVLTEHGVYVREAYLAAVAQRRRAGRAVRRTRLARGLARCAYDGADVVSPGDRGERRWESASASIRQDPRPPQRLQRPGRRRRRRGPDGGLRRSHRSAEGRPHDAPGRRGDAEARAGRAASCTTARSTAGEEVYGRSCRALHEQLGLGDRFRFMGRTTDPNGVVRDADVVLMTSISEGLPMSILEAMARAGRSSRPASAASRTSSRAAASSRRPATPTALAMGVVTLLRQPEFA